MTHTLKHNVGYEITVRSWENDGNFHNTVIFETTYKPKAEAVVALAKLLYSGSKLSNLYAPDKEEVLEFNNALILFYSKYPDIFSYERYHEEIITEKPENEKDVVNWLTDILYELGLTYGEQFTRVCESVNCVYFAQPVYAEEINFD